MQTHMAWDNGMIAAVILRATGVAAPQKTTKAWCGRRVPMGQIDNTSPTCDGCVTAWLEDTYAIEDAVIASLKG